MTRLFTSDIIKRPKSSERWKWTMGVYLPETVTALARVMLTWRQRPAAGQGIIGCMISTENQFCNYTATYSIHDIACKIQCIGDLKMWHSQDSVVTEYMRWCYIVSTQKVNCIQIQLQKKDSNQVTYTLWKKGDWQQDYVIIGCM